MALILPKPKQVDADPAELYFARRRQMSGFKKETVKPLKFRLTQKLYRDVNEHENHTLIKCLSCAGIVLGMIIAVYCYLRMVQCFYVLNYHPGNSFADKFFNNQCEASHDFTWAYGHLKDLFLRLFSK